MSRKLLILIVIGLKIKFTIQAENMCICLEYDSCKFLSPSKNEFLNEPDGRKICNGKGESLKLLTIIRPEFVEFNDKALQHFPVLEELEIVGGETLRKITKIDGQSLKFLEIRHIDSIDCIEENAFSNALNLTTLSLLNIGLKTILPEIFNGLNNLVDLTLSQNKITNLDNMTFQGMDKLQFLKLDNNLLEKLENGIFENINLFFLDLSGNRLMEFDASNYRIKQLNLKSNALTTFNINGWMTDLKLDSNNISTINVEQPNNLTKLIMRNNSLEDMSNITKLEMLTYLSLAENPVKNVNISNLKHLKQLYLYRINLKLVDGIFDSLPMLELLDLSYNNLTELDFSLFQHQKQLKHLNLDGNNFSSLDYSQARDMMPRLLIIEICEMNTWNSWALTNNLYKMRSENFQADILGLDRILPKEYVKICATIINHDDKIKNGDYEEYDYDAAIEEIREKVHATVITQTTTTSTSTTEIVILVVGGSFGFIIYIGIQLYI